MSSVSVKDLFSWPAGLIKDGQRGWFVFVGDRVERNKRICCSG